MLKIRLARIGKKKSPTYRFVVSENARDLYGKQLEILGHYNPFSKVCEVKKDRILYWISKGAQLSPTVHNLFVDQNVITAEKVKASKPGKKSAEAGSASLAGPAGGKAAEEKVAEEKPAEAPAEEKLKEEKKGEKPAEEKASVAEAPKAEEKVAEEKPAEEKTKEDGAS